MIKSGWRNEHELNVSCESGRGAAREFHRGGRDTLPARRVNASPGGFSMCSGLETLPLSSKGVPALSLTTASSCCCEQPIKLNEAMSVAVPSTSKRNLMIKLPGRAAAPRFPGGFVRAPRASSGSRVLRSRELRAELEQAHDVAGRSWGFNRHARVPPQPT